MGKVVPIKEAEPTLHELLSKLQEEVQANEDYNAPVSSLVVISILANDNGFKFVHGNSSLEILGLVSMFQSEVASGLYFQNDSDIE